jgi:hypothetical protein
MPESTEGVAAGQTTALDYENEANRTEKNRKSGTSIGQIKQKLRLKSQESDMCAFGGAL